MTTPNSTFPTPEELRVLRESSAAREEQSAKNQEQVRHRRDEKARETGARLAREMVPSFGTYMRANPHQNQWTLRGVCIADLKQHDVLQGLESYLWGIEGEEMVLSKSPDATARLCHQTFLRTLVKVLSEKGFVVRADDEGNDVIVELPKK